jgi:hypothetical protein
MKTPILTIKNLISEKQCYETICSLRWPDKLRCPHCNSKHLIKRGRHRHQTARCRYDCKSGGKRFDDLTGTVLPTCIDLDSVLIFQGLKLTKYPDSPRHDLNKDDTQQMTETLRVGIDKKKTQ